MSENKNKCGGCHDKEDDDGCCGNEQGGGCSDGSCDDQGGCSGHGGSSKDQGCPSQKPQKPADADGSKKSG